MVRNDQRRQAIADAAIAVLADAGARGLTFRAVDAMAEVPTGTTSNYFRTRPVLVEAILERIRTRLTPEAEVRERLALREPGPALFADYMRDIVGRLLGDREATTALFALRIDATRRIDVFAGIVDWRRREFDEGVAFNAEAGLPGGRLHVALFHYALDGFVLDQLTGPMADDISADEVIDALVSGLLGPTNANGT